MWTENTLINKTPGLPSHEVHGQIVILNPTTQRVHECNSTAGLVWSELSNEGKTFDQLLNILCNTFSVEKSVAQKDLEGLLCQMLQEKLIQTKPEC